VVAAQASLADKAMSNYSQQCAACHGANGLHGAARPLADANYLASVGRASLISITTRGVPGGFCPGCGPGSLANWNAAAVASFVDGLLASWGRGGKASDIPWSVQAAAAGDASRGRAVYDALCQSCHGAASPPRGATAGSVTDPSYLKLITDQGLRSAVIFGRADMGMPAAGGPFPGQLGRALTGQEVSDVVAFLRAAASQRSQP
jgi:cytochrome c oxidase cbb3-type subunit 3/ubiquinol-cytochrome c reductase cytochrome c subunit